MGKGKKEMSKQQIGEMCMCACVRACACVCIYFGGEDGSKLRRNVSHGFFDSGKLSILGLSVILFKIQFNPFF